MSDLGHRAERGDAHEHVDLQREAAPPSLEELRATSRSRARAVPAGHETKREVVSTSKVSTCGRGQHPASQRALRQYGPRRGEPSRNPTGRNGWESTRRVREAFGEALEQDVGNGQTLFDALEARAAHFAQTGSSRDLYELLRYVAPPTQRFDAELGLSAQLEAELEEQRRRGPYLEPFVIEEEAVESAPDDR